MDEETKEKIKAMLREHDEKEKAQRKPIPKPKPVIKPKPKPKPKEPGILIEENGVKLPKKDFETLIAMAKRADVEGMEPIPKAPPRIIEETPQPVQPQAQPETIGEQIEQEKEQENTQAQAVQEFDPQQIKIEDVDDYADILKRPMVLYFDTDRTCSIIQPKIERDGSVRIHDRMFDFTEGQPSVIKFGGRKSSKSHPFYIIKYDNMLPLDLVEWPPSNPTPEETTRLVDLKTLETLSQIAGAKLKKAPLIILMLASFFGGIVVKLVLGMLGIW